MSAPHWRDRPIADARRATGNALYPHRQWLAQQLLAAAAGISAPSVLEVGCSYGPNLVRIQHLVPSAMLYGLDISPANIDVGRRFSREHGVPTQAIHLEIGDMRQPLPFSTGSVDIVFTDATLLYANPLQVRRVLREMVRVSRCVVGTLELTGRGRHYVHRRTRDGWIHSYEPLLNRIGGVDSSSRKPLPPGTRNAGRWPNLGALTLAGVRATLA